MSGEDGAVDRRGLIGAAGLVGALLAGPARAQASEEDRRLREDWAWLGRYAEDNRRVIASGQRVSTVFMGDSITEGWRDKRPAFFGDARIGRGISGQTTPQMLVRTMPDVVALRPQLVHIMAGTNDIAGNTGPMTTKQTCDNLAAMAAIAKANGVRVLLASVPPADGFPWRPGLQTVAPIREINAWIERHAAETGATFVDYTPALATPAGAIRPGMADDGVHPTEAGYDAMIAVLEPVLARLEARA